MDVFAVRRLIDKALGSLRFPFRAVGSGANSAPQVILIQAEALSGEPLRDAELFQQYGFTSTPPDGSQYICAAVGGRTSHAVAIASEHASRLAGLQKGESAQYDDQGQKIVIYRDRIEIETSKPIVLKSPVKIRAETPVLECTGEIKDLCDSDSGRTMSSMRSVYDGHTHPENDSGGPTDPPNQTMS